MPMFFRNRAEAGHRLCERLKYLQGTDLVVLGLPRGGVRPPLGRVGSTHH